MTLGTVAIAARAVFSELVRAVVALPHVGAESGCAACGDVAERLPLLAGENVTPAVEEFLCPYWRKTSATSNRASLTAGVHHHESGRWAGVAGRRKD